jgi:hypothetical protein
MTGWDVLNNTIAVFPPVAAVLLLIAAGTVFIVGFARYGTNFIKCGFAQTTLGASLEKRFDDFEAKQGKRFDDFEAKQEKRFGEFEARQEKRFDEFETRLDGFETRLDGFEGRLDKIENRLDRIEVNHFGHLKSYLGVLNGILLDKGVIDNESKARLDNELHGM